MEQLAEINFIAAIEGQDAERAMAKIVSIAFSFLNVPIRIRMLTLNFTNLTCLRMLIVMFNYLHTRASLDLTSRHSRRLL